MTNRFTITNIRDALVSRQFPTVTAWNRLEGRPRTANFDRALKAEIRDALWMLTKQWQLGEFQGDDAGSPVFAKLHLDTTRLTKYQAASNPVEAFETAVPLEAKVERRPIPFTLAGQEISLDLRLLMGRQWLKLVRSVGNFTQGYLDRYPIALPNPSLKKDAQLCAHQEVWQTFAAVAGRRLDGYKLYLYLKESTTHHAYDGILVPDADKFAIDTLATKFINWFETLYYQPSSEDAWQPSRLEYQFACSAPTSTGEKVYRAEEYYQGHLDWYNFDLDPTSGGLGTPPASPAPPATDTQTLIPVPITFEGMPNTRWWAFEDRLTNFGDIKPDTTDLAKLLLIEFGLVYANDWFLIPYTLPVGSIARIRGMMVTNVFGERFWIEAAGSGLDDNWQRWSMFTINTKGNAKEVADTSLLLLPTVPKIQESSPLEEVMLIRDEMANMVWAIEKTIPLASGNSKAGSEAAIETHNYYQRILSPTPSVTPVPTSPPNNANISYLAMTSVPEHWIPFIPVHLKDDVREIQLQRAAMPRILEGDSSKPRKVRPRTVLMQFGLDEKKPYFIHEEEVPCAGIRVAQSFQRTRWNDGRTFVWFGVRKQTGRGEGSSGLAFDQIVDMKS
ncbi:hypothetical protein [Nostoc sp. 106C]|uniref:hypothetical protein n=1 Tax=Nostoc sp. 106C TaxID=1932667 RepID=UPI000A384685|nr:hypothetical protein [Nostoc sp. 106C]OUL36550.1 hypothetical protein BV375_00030 [Nostoc sp. 106C]